MFFRTPRFIRRFFRSRMKPVGEEKAWDVKQKLSILYAIIAWNCGGYVIYQMATGNKHWPITYGIRSKDEDMVRPAIAWAASLGIEKGEVIRIGRDFSVSAPAKFEIDMDAHLKKKMLEREFNVHDPTPTVYTIVEGEDLPNPSVMDNLTPEDKKTKKEV